MQHNFDIKTKLYIMLVLMVSVSDHHKYNGLEPYKLTLLWFWRQELWNQLHQAKVKVLGEPPLSGGSREKFMPLTFPSSPDAFVAFFVSYAFFHLQSHKCSILFQSQNTAFFTLFLTFSPWFSPLWGDFL